MPKVSEEHLQARRQQILDAAATCFAREGFHRTSMQDIVKECGVSAGLVYRYFASKDEVIAAIVSDWRLNRAQTLTPDTLVSGYLEILRGVAESPAAGRLAVQVWAETVRSPEIRALARQAVDEPRATLAGALKDLPPGLDPDSVVRIFVAIYQGLVVQNVWDDDVDNERYIETVATLIHGIFGGDTALA